MTDDARASAPPEGQGSVLGRSEGASIFGTDAAGYHRSRPGYPQALFQNIRSRSAAAREILEIGAGTGLASAELLRFEPSQLTIVEPDPALCTFLKERFDDHPVTVKQAAFAEVSLPGQFDLIACAAAFHWLEPKSALAKVRSLLVPNGTWAMWWNTYFGHDEADPLAERAARLFDDEAIDLPPSYEQGRHYALDRTQRISDLREAGFRDIEHTHYRTRIKLTSEEAADLYGTFSFIRLLPLAKRERLLGQIAQIVDDELGGEAGSVVVSSLYLASR